MGRQAAGVIGIRLKAKDFVVGMEVIADHGDILFATQNGYGNGYQLLISVWRIAAVLVFALFRQINATARLLDLRMLLIAQTSC